jgi:hypothetical protein
MCVAVVVGIASCAEPAPTPTSTSRDEASETIGERLCVHVVGDVVTFDSLSVPFAGGSVTKYLAPAFEDARVVYDPAGFVQATELASYVWQDILVLDEAPIDVQRVIAASVTATRQGILSHLDVRAAVRGSPNCY